MLAMSEILLKHQLRTDKNSFGWTLQALITYLNNCDDNFQTYFLNTVTLMPSQFTTMYCVISIKFWLPNQKSFANPIEWDTDSTLI